MTHRPPRLARLLLRLLVPDPAHHDLAGDLEERFNRQAETDPTAARRAYWRDVLSPSLLHLRREVKGMHLPPGAPPTGHPGDGFMSKLLTDVRFAFRMMRKAPAFTAVAVISLALGIGPNTAIFSLVNAALFQDWGVQEPETVMDVYSLQPDGRYFYTYYRVYELIQEGAADAFDGIAASAQYMGTMEVRGADELLLGELVTGNYFDVLGVAAARGRTFVPEEDATPGTHPVVVISDQVWRTRFAADPDVVGGEVRLNGRPYTVVGVAPPEFRGRIAPGIGTDFWAPLRMYPHLAPSQMGSGNLFFMGRLADGVTPDRARSMLDAAAARYNEERPDSRNRLALGAVTLSEIRLHPSLDGVIGAMAVLLLAAVGLVLLVACVNLAGFLLARATDRRKEMAVRVAMGAGRGDVIRQLLVESLMLATLGGVLGLILGLGALRLLLSVDPPVAIPMSLEVGLNGRLLLFTAGASLAAALLFGLAPALEATRAPVAATLRDEAGSSGGRKKASARSLMVAGQMALSTVLLVAAALFVRSLQNAAAVDPGFDTGPAAVVTVDAWASDMEPEAQARYVEDLRRDLADEPGIERVALTGRLPLDLGVTNAGFDIPGVDPPADSDFHVVELTYVTPGYFDVMGIPVVDGRDFTSQDAEAAPRPVIVTAAMATRYWPDGSAVGRVLHRRGDPEDAFVVVGVAGDAKIWSLTEEPRPYLYMPMAPGAFARYHVVARGSLPPARMAETIRARARALQPDIFLSKVGTMDDHLGYIYFLPRMGALVLSLVGLLALILACVGLYGMVSYAVARRTRELGVRLALGADRTELVKMVVRGGLTVVAIGGALGLLAAAALGSSLERFLIGVDGVDLLALSAAPAVLGLVALTAAYLPARRASRVDPVEALRSE